MPIQSVNPATGQLLATFETLDSPAIEDRLALAWTAFALWKSTSFSERAHLILRAADILEAEAEQLGPLYDRRDGETNSRSRRRSSEVGKRLPVLCAACRAVSPGGGTSDGGRRSFIRYEPVGPVLAIMPWNFPIWQVFRFAAPAIMAGNVALLKHAPNVPQCAMAIENIFTRAGVPRGVFQNLPIGTDQVRAVLADPRVRAVTLTGSERAGREVAAQAGRALKKSVLELGGSEGFGPR
jgi:succinate-semialdehyde dehydrogenase/glutarate-semialdehyde dehydrogenase